MSPAVLRSIDRVPCVGGQGAKVSHPLYTIEHMFEDALPAAAIDPVFGRPGSHYPKANTWVDQLRSAPPPGSAETAPVAARDDSKLDAEAEIMALASKIAAAHGRIVEIIATHGEDLSGPDDLSRWLSWAAGMKPTTAKATVRHGL